MPGNRTPQCPACRGTVAHERPRLGDWTCLECGHCWKPAAPAAPAAGQRARLFLSYGRRDAQPLADRLRADLEGEGFEVWQDTRRIRPGREWEQEIRDGLRSTQLVVALLSPHAVRLSGDPASPDQLDSVCLDEISFARFGRPPKPIVPVMAVPCEPPFCIFRLDYIEMCAWSDSADQYAVGYRRLREAIDAALVGETRYRSWEHQLRPWDFGPFLSEKRRRFCGRQWLFDEIDAWRATGRDQTLIITGEPGTGKSAVVAELVHRNPGGQVIAYHCCQADTPATLHAGRFVRSLAAMIASRLPGYAARLEDAMVAATLAPAASDHDPASALEEGILTPLEAVPAPDEGVRYVLIDALDEALTAAEAAHPNIVDLLAGRLGRLPGWLRIVATTRKEPEVLERLSGLRPFELDAQDPRNLADVEQYIARRLDSPDLSEALVRGRNPREQAAALLLRRSEGNFLYVQQALDGIERGLPGLEDFNRLPPGLTGLYGTFFRRQFPEPAGYALPQRVLQLLVAAREPLAVDHLARAGGLDIEEELPIILRSLAPYLREHEGRYRLYHKSLSDWLTDPSLRGTSFSASPGRGHEMLAASCWAEYVCGPETMSGYAVAHLPAHLRESGRWDELGQALCDLRYVEAKCAAALTSDLIADYAAAVAGLPRAKPGCDLPDDSGGAELLAEIRRAARADGESGGGAWASVGDLECFSAFVMTEAHLLSATPHEALPLARNHAASGPVVQQAERLLAEAGRPWIARDPRPGPLPVRPACRRTLQGHARWVYGVSVTEDGRTALSASGDYTVRVWDVGTGACLRTLNGHTSYVYCVAATADGRRAVSGSADGTARLWDVPGGRCLAVLRGHGRPVRGVALSRDGSLAVTCSSDRTLRVWDVASAACQRVLHGHTAHVFAVALSTDATTAVSAAGDETLRVWDLRSGTCLRSLAAHSGAVRGVALSGDGQLAVSGGEDGTVRAWDVTTGTCLGILAGHAGPVHGVALTDDGAVALTGGRDGTLRVWDVRRGACLRVLEGHHDVVWAVAATAAGTTVVTGSYDNTLRVWDICGYTQCPLEGHAGEVLRLTATTDRQAVVSLGEDRTLRIWGADGVCQRILDAAGYHPGDVALSGDGRMLVTVGDDRTIRVWSAATGECLRTLAGPDETRGVALAPDGRHAVSRNFQGIAVWDLATGSCLWSAPVNTNEVNGVGFAADGRTLITVSFKLIRMWDAATGECLSTLEGHVDWVRTFFASADGATLLSASDDRTVRLWDLATGECLRIFGGHTGGVFAVAGSPDGQTVVSAGVDQTLRVWDASGRLLHELRGHGALVNSVMLTHDGRLAVSGSRDGSVRCWDLATGRCLAVYQAGDAIAAMTGLGPDGRFVVATRDGQLHFLGLQGISE